MTNAAHPQSRLGRRGFRGARALESSAQKIRAVVGSLRAPRDIGSRFLATGFSLLFLLLLMRDALTRSGNLPHLDTSQALAVAVPVLTVIVAIFFGAAIVQNLRTRTFKRPELSGVLFWIFWVWVLARSISGELVPSGSAASVVLALLIMVLGPDLSLLSRWSLMFCRLYVAGSFALSAFVTVNASEIPDNFGLKLTEFAFPLSGLASHPNPLGALAALGLILEFHRPSSRLTWIWRILFLITLVLSYSFGAAGALIASLAVLSAAWLKWPGKRKQSIILGATLLLSSGTALLLLLGSGRLESIDSFTTGRVELWQTLLPSNLVELAIGSGVHQFSGSFPNNAHNDWLQALTVGGLVAVLLLTAALIAKISELARLERSDRVLLVSLLVFGLTLGLVEVPQTPSFSISIVFVILLWFSRPQQLLAQRSTVYPRASAGIQESPKN